MLQRVWLEGQTTPTRHPAHLILSLPLTLQAAPPAPPTTASRIVTIDACRLEYIYDMLTRLAVARSAWMLKNAS